MTHRISKRCTFIAQHISRLKIGEIGNERHVRILPQIELLGSRYTYSRSCNTIRGDFSRGTLQYDIIGQKDHIGLSEIHGGAKSLCRYRGNLFIVLKRSNLHPRLSNIQRRNHPRSIHPIREVRFYYIYEFTRYPEESIWINSTHMGRIHPRYVHIIMRPWDGPISYILLTADAL